MEVRWLWRTLTILVIISKYPSVESVKPQSSSDDKNSNRINLEKNKFSDFTKLELSSSDVVNNSFRDEALSASVNSDQEEFIDKLSDQPHSRKKRLIWVTDDGRLALPPGTTLSITPTIAMPLVRHPPEGFLSNITISFPVTLDFDKLGLTDNQNPLGVLPPVFARSFGRSAGSLLGDYIANYLHYRSKRDLNQMNERKYENKNVKVNFASNEDLIAPELPKEFKHVFHGGERALLYKAVEDFISTFGMNGKACLLRTICEVHSRSMDHFGFFGEFVKLFLTATKSPFAQHIPEYVEAQRIGEGKIAPGECFPYYKECPRGLFKVSVDHKYGENADDAHKNEIDDVNQSFSDLKMDMLNKVGKSVKNFSPEMSLM